MEGLRQLVELERDKDYPAWPWWLIRLIVLAIYGAIGGVFCLAAWWLFA